VNEYINVHVGVCVCTRLCNDPYISFLLGKLYPSSTSGTLVCFNFILTDLSFLIRIFVLDSSDHTLLSIYADDIQLCMLSTIHYLPVTIYRLDGVIHSIKQGLQNNMLCLNENKTEAITFGSKALLNKCPAQTIKIGSEMIFFIQSVKDLGMMLNSQLTMQPRVNKICKVSFAYLRLISGQNECCSCFRVFPSHL
jgi:hypothetical protein